MSRLAAIGELLALARKHGASPDAFKFLVTEQEAATMLLFEYLGMDEDGRRRWRVGPPHAPVEFATTLEAVASLHLLARHKRVPVRDIADVPTARVAAWNKLRRAIDAISEHCPVLADELSGFRIKAGHALYCRRGPHILAK